MGNEIENLNLEQVNAALVAGGYTDNRLLSVEFKGYTTRGAARYAIIYGDNDVDTAGYGFVFIENVPGVGFVADF